MDLFKSIMAFVFVFILIMSTAILIPTLPAHENKEFKHGSTGECFGWKNLGNNVFMCYRNEEQTICAYIIYAHEKWHASKEVKCPEQPEK